MDSNEYAAQAILQALQNELEMHGRQFQSLPVELADALATDRSKATRLYRSVDWWGGSGSLADAIPDDAEARRRIMRLLVDLERAFDTMGIPCPRARQWTSVFAEWLDRGIV